ncbi:MAG: hypothetical protein ACE1ZF_06445 [Gemmatimonadales bacterium]
MTLIPCPECDTPVSDMAAACPKCGFPVAAGIRHAVNQLTDDESTKSARQQHAAARLKTWGERYLQTGQADPDHARGDNFLDRHWKGILFIFVAVIVILQLTWVLSMFG